MKIIRLTAIQDQTDRLNNKNKKQVEVRVVKKAKTLYAKQNPKPRDNKTKLFTRKIVKIVNKKYHTNVTQRRVEKLGNQGFVCVTSPMKGPYNGVHPKTSHFSTIDLI